MDNKEFNLQILAKLVEFAREIFQKMTLNVEGTFTAAELYNEKTSWGEKITINYHGDQFNEVYEADVNGFHFKICPFCIFSTLYKFEKLCNVKQKDKARFTFGAAKEVINEKCMYIGKDKKILIRKKSLCRISDNVAYEQIDKYRVNIYYKGGDTWHYIYVTQKELLNVGIVKNMAENEKFIIDALAKWDYTSENQLTPIYKALYDVLRPKPTKDAPISGKRKTKPENSVICDKDNESIKKLSENIGKDSENRVYVRIKHTWHLLVGFGGYDAEIITEKGKHELLYLKSILEEMKNGESGICEQNDKILSMLSEDYPPEPYNEANTDDTGQKIEKCESSCDNQERKCIVEHVSDIRGKNMRPNYLRQKVFPNELFYVRRKISRFEPRCSLGGISHHHYKENTLERKRNGNTSVYRVLIRGK